MNWDLRLSNRAARALRSIPTRDQARVNSALNTMKIDPLAGDVAAMRGEYRGVFRRRVGNWRIVFSIHADERQVRIHDILRRASTTY